MRVCLDVHIIFLIHTCDLSGAPWVSGERRVEKRGMTNQRDLRCKKRKE